jgi:hypothetical protein
VKKLFLLLATFGFLVTSIVNAFGQAAAESALINGLSSTATVKAGTDLNHALDHGVNQLGARVQQSTSGLAQPGLQPRPTGAAKGTTTAMQSHNTAQPGSTQAFGGIMIRGGRLTCTPLNPRGQSSAGQASGTSTNCNGQMPTAKAQTQSDATQSNALPASK